MLYEVRVYTPKGNLKKVVSKEQLSKKHWEDFKKSNNINSKVKTLLARTGEYINRRLK